MSQTIKELTAMKLVAEAIEPLEVDARVRVLRWVVDHFDVASVTLGKSSGASNEVPPTPNASPDDVSVKAQEQSEFDSLGELYAVASPSSDAEKALVAGYWLQEHDGQAGFGTQEINRELKHLGYGIGNITRAFDTLKKTKPQQVIQLRKAGNTQQARKTFKLTVAGVKEVEAMVAKNAV